jgi:hypothetical protein
LPFLLDITNENHHFQHLGSENGNRREEERDETVCVLVCMWGDGVGEKKGVGDQDQKGEYEALQAHYGGTPKVQLSGRPMSRPTQISFVSSLCGCHTMKVRLEILGRALKAGFHRTPVCQDQVVGKQRC